MRGAVGRFHGMAPSTVGVTTLTFVCLLASCSSNASPVSSSTATADGAAPEGSVGADTWINYAAGFFQTYCTDCHNAQDSTGRDYTVRADVAKDKDSMRCGVAATQDPAWNCAASPVARQFPIGTGPKPTDADRARIVAWIDAGEP